MLKLFITLSVLQIINGLPENLNTMKSHGVRIINGSDAPEGKYPSLVSLQQRGYHICGAFILTKHFVATAAHCVESSSVILRELQIVSSITNLYDKARSRKYQVTEIISHEKYNASDLLVNDIALLMINPSFSLDTGEALAMLPKKMETQPTGAMASAVGWGRKVHGGIASYLLQEVEMRILNYWDCSQIIGQIHSTQFCVESKNSGICEGDSGGPLYVNEQVVGIASWRDGNKPCGRAMGVYTQLSLYTDWVNMHVTQRSLQPTN
ncbi:trypsin delta-like [Neocloeon triangulifer]|uniref:trypsin delta-like n=1 Tax=Neocloeon triangulifer TaxID=2078957 RepID=UPI00286F4877|nr:trypsin delta-like [Neocloeon triangulifer]